MSELDNKKKAIILGVPTIVIVAIVAGWMSSTENVQWSGQLLLFSAPIGFGIGWMILNLFTIVENV